MNTPLSVSPVPPVNVWKALARTLVLTLLGMTLFEISKQVAHPSISLWESHAITILFSSVLAMTITFFVVRRQQRLTHHLLETIAEQRRTEKALQENQRFLQKIADTTPSLLYLYDVIEKRNVYVNQQIRELLGYSPQEIQRMGSSILELLHPADLNIFNGHIERIKTAGDGQLVEFECRIKHAIGEWRWLLSRDSVFTRTPEGAPRLLLGTAEDVTLRKQTAETLLRAQSQLERRVQERTTELARTNASLHEQIHEYEQAERVARAQTTVLAQSLQSLTTNLTLDTFLRHVLVAITEQLRAFSVAFYVCDWEHERVRLELTHLADQPYPESPVDDPQKNLSPLQFSTEDLIMQTLNRTPVPLIIEHVSETPLLAREVRVWAAEAGVKMMLFIPLFSESQLLGVIRICNQGQRHYYRAEEIELAQALAHQITLALQLARVSVQEQRAAILSERTRLAREMHDTLSQGFTGIVIQMEGAEDLLDNDPQNIEELRLHLQRARTLARDSLAEARRAVWELRPSLLEQGTLTTALTQMIEQLTVGVGIQASFLCRGAPQPLPLLLEESLFRIAQEALSNALLHARAQTVQSILTFGDQQVTLEVNDDGQGFDKAKLTTQGFGLISMQERIARIGGHLTISSQEGRGTTLCAVAPVLPRGKWGSSHEAHGEDESYSHSDRR